MNSNGEITAGSYVLAVLSEIVLTFIFVLAILGVTSKTENGTVAGIVIGLVLTLVHLLGIRLTGTSVNPARSIGPALLALANGATEPIKEIWIFIVGPFAGAALAGLVFNKLLAPKAAPAAK
jgi:aquaporin Z